MLYKRKGDYIYMKEKLKILAAIVFTLGMMYLFYLQDKGLIP